MTRRRVPLHARDETRARPRRRRRDTRTHTSDNTRCSPSEPPRKRPPSPSTRAPRRRVTPRGARARYHHHRRREGRSRLESRGVDRDASGRAREVERRGMGRMYFFTRGRVARGRRDATLAVARARSRSTSIGAAIDRDRSNPSSRARIHGARARRGIERGIERARLTNEIFSLKRTAPSSPRRLPSPPPPPPCSSPGPRTRKSSA